jgi:hypothetical protein
MENRCLNKIKRRRKKLFSFFFFLFSNKNTTKKYMEKEEEFETLETPFYLTQNGKYYNCYTNSGLLFNATINDATLFKITEGKICMVENNEPYFLGKYVINITSGFIKENGSGFYLCNSPFGLLVEPDNKKKVIAEFVSDGKPLLK